MAKVNDILSCYECNKECDNIEDLNYHIRTNHVFSTNQCNVCEYQGKNQIDLRNHSRVHNVQENVFKCEECAFQDKNEENVLNHRIAKHVKNACDQCDYETTLETNLKKHRSDKHEKVTGQVYQCDVCNFCDTREENVLNHEIAKHSKHNCDLCDFVSENDINVRNHRRDAHPQTSFKCRKCPLNFISSSKLNEHVKNVHEVPSFPCDHCGHKADNLNNLDTHIQSYHKIEKVPRKTPCDFKSPQHTSNCCDRDQGKPMKFFTFQETLQNGPCRNWNETVCDFGDLCKYAHIELCRFQERCRYSFNCRFFHFDHSNISFLGGKSFRHPFLFNSQDFPPLSANQNQRK